LLGTLFWIENHQYLSGPMIRGATQNAIASRQRLLDTLLTPGATHAGNRKLDLFHFASSCFCETGISLPIA
jgi:hypothetical protein